MTWIPLLAASMNPEETPLFRYELTEETHKAEGDSVRGVRGSVLWQDTAVTLVLFVSLS